VLDVLMPGLDGREVLRRLRAGGRFNPVVLLTQVGAAGERAMALEEGADDYLNKPFDPAELVARIRAVLRRAQPGRPSLAATRRLESGPLALDRVARRAWLGGDELHLTPKALALLEYLLTHPDELLTRDRLLDVLWGWEYPGGTRAVDNRVAELRRALADDAASPAWIETVPGSGYRFVAEVQATAYNVCSDVLFDFDKATIRPDAEAVLRQVARSLDERFAGRRIRIDGHTDAQGSDAYNDGLSSRRAESVKRWLAAHGIASGRISTRGYGEREPVAANATSAGRQKNRRVVIGVSTR
jgi:DNA-binding response OmpR family regulator